MNEADFEAYASAPINLKRLAGVLHALFDEADDAPGQTRRLLFLCPHAAHVATLSKLA